MKHEYRVGILVILLAVMTSGCSGTGSPSIPPLQDEPDSASEPALTTQATPSHAGNHYLWSYNLVYIDATNPEELDFEIIPVRQVADHWNVLGWLEQWPCKNCFELVGLTPSGSGTLLADIKITHPFSQLNFTGFDVRGIAMFDASHTFPASALTVSDRAVGDGELVNADGYTTLYNSTTIGSGPDGLQGYIKGNLATVQAPNALLNGYKRHITDDPDNTRNAFYAADSITVSYEVDMPDGVFVFGYAVDANWAPPTSKPVTDPMTQFGPEANCPEPWKIEVSGDPIGFIGSTDLLIDVYDRQGSVTHSEPALECPELFDSSLGATWVADGDGYSSYEVTVTNDKWAPGGRYKCLVSVEDEENDTAPEWLDLTGYQVYEIPVEGPPVALAGAEPNPQDAGSPVHFFDDGSYDPDGGDIVSFEWDWDYDGTFDEEGADVYHTWASAGNYQVGFRVTDDEGLPDWLDEPLNISITAEGAPTSPIEVTPPWLNFVPYNVCVDGTYAYIAGGANGLHIIDISNPSNPTWVKRVVTASDVLHVAVSQGYAYVSTEYSGLLVVDVDPLNSAQVVHTIEQMAPSAAAVEGNYAYVVDDYFGMLIVDITSPESASVIKTVELQGTFWFLPQDIAVLNGIACIAGEFDGVRILDVDPPLSAHVVASIEEPMWSCAQGVDMAGDYAYVADANIGLQIIDISVPESSHVVKQVHKNSFFWDVAVSDGYAYVAADEYGGLQIIDVDPPATASIVNSVDTPGCAYKLDAAAGYVYMADCGQGLQVIDVSPPGSAGIVGNTDTVGYSYDVDVAQGHAFMADWSGGLQIVDVDPPHIAYVLGDIELPGRANGVVIDGYYAYVANNYGFLQIIELDPGGSANLVKSVELPGFTNAVAVSGGYAYMADGEEGLQIVDIDPPGEAYVLTAVPMPGETTDVAVSGSHAYVTGEEGDSINKTGYLRIVDIDPPDSPTVVKFVVTSKPTLGVDVTGGYAYVAGSGDGLLIIDVDPPGSASIVHTVDMTSSANDVMVSGSYAYVAAYFMTAFDISTPESAFILSETSTWRAERICVVDDYAYVAAGSRGLRIIRLW